MERGSPALSEYSWNHFKPGAGSMKLYSQKELSTQSNAFLFISEVTVAQPPSLGYLGHGMASPTPSWSSSPPKGPAGQVQPMAEVLWGPPRLSPPSREYKAPARRYPGLGHFSNSAAPNILGAWATSWMCLRPWKNQDAWLTLWSLDPRSIGAVHFLSNWQWCGIIHPSLSAYILGPWVLFAFPVFSMKDSSNPTGGGLSSDPRSGARSEIRDLDSGRALTSSCRPSSPPTTPPPHHPTPRPQGALLWGHLTRLHGSTRGPGLRVTQVYGPVGKWLCIISGWRNWVQPIMYAPVRDLTLS